MILFASSISFRNIGFKYHVSVDIEEICNRCRCDIMLTRSDLRNKQTYFDSLVWSPPHLGCLAGRLSSIQYSAHWTQICWIFACGRFPGCEYLGFPGPAAAVHTTETDSCSRGAYVITIIKLSELTALCLVGILPKHRVQEIDENWTLQHGSTRVARVSFRNISSGNWYQHLWMSCNGSSYFINNFFIERSSFWL